MRSGITDTDSIVKDIRSAVVAHFSNFDDAPVKGNIARFEKIAGLRIVSLILLFIQFAFIHIPVLAICGSSQETNNDIFRALSMVCAFFLNLHAMVILNGALTKFKMLQTVFIVNFLCMVFEMSMFHLGSHHSIVIPFGIIGVILRFIQIIISSRMNFVALRAGASSEELYTRYMDHFYTDSMHAEVDRVYKKVMSYDPQNQQEALHLASLMGETSCGLKNGDEREDLSDTQMDLPNIASQDSQTLFDAGGASPQLMKWKVWNCVHHIRKTLFLRDAFGRKVCLWFLTVLMLLTFVNFTYEFIKIFANQTPLLDDDLNNKYNEESITKAYMPTRTHDNWKVHIVVVDGLRYDHTEDGASALGSYINSPAFRPNSMRFKAKAQLPSFSVPNWMSILTGAPPETHGVTGNLGNDETSFDHIFRQAKNYGIHGGMTGTPWWKNLVFSTLPPLDGDGTVDASFVPHGTPKYPKDTSDPADGARLAVALKAARRSTLVDPFAPQQDVKKMYELFLTHFSDVDKQGHEYGIDTKWNNDNSYMRAIANKTQAIQDIVNTIDNSTVLIITSDHGHVQRGGHGGVPMVLRDVPVVFYVKGMPMTTPTPTNFRANEAPRAEDDGAYQNLDICSTVCAILGIPAPRQSIGIFIEEAVETFVPAAVRRMHYYDLFMAKLSSFKEYREMLSVGMFRGFGKSLDSPTVQVLEASNATATEREYADAIREMRPDYWFMRATRKNYIYIRNLVCSLLLIIPFILLLIFIFDTATVVNIPSMLDSKSPASALNRAACFKAFLTVLFYILASIVVFIVIYFPVTGYTVWDSTLTHTPSVATTYLSTTIIAPILIFVVLTKIFLASAIQWKTALIVLETKHKLKKLGLYRIGAIINNLLWDIKTICFTTSHYKAAKFPEVYMYLYFLTFWTSVMTFIVFLTGFNFTWIVPIVFSTEHVTENNLQHRFRVITIMMMLIPLQVGTMMLLYFRPDLQAEFILHWDNLFIQAHLEPDLYDLRQQHLKLGGEPQEMSANPPMAQSGVGSTEGNNNSSLKVESVHGTPPNNNSMEVREDDNENSAAANEGSKFGNVTIEEISQRMNMLENCMLAMQDNAFRVSPAELFLATFYDIGKDQAMFTPRGSQGSRGSVGSPK